MEQPKYQVLPYPRSRQAIVDYITVAQRKNIIHGLIEVDVTLPRQFIQERKARTGEVLSFTAFIITCLARAIDENKVLHAYRAGRNRLIVYDEVDISTPIERQVKGHRIGTPHVIRAANKMTFREIHQEIRTAQVEESGEFKRMDWYGLLPNFIGRLFWRFLGKYPHWRKRLMGTVGVTAVGMFGRGGGWGIPITDYTLQLSLGGIAEKPGINAGHIEAREYLSLTISMDHDVIDGAPAARAAQRLKELIEAGYGLTEAIQEPKT